jgi:hypothetical protein
VAGVRLSGVRFLDVTGALPLVVLGVLVAFDLWVYLDAAARARADRPVVLSVGSFTLDTPAVWFVACLVLSLLFIPLYLANR